MSVNSTCHENGIYFITFTCYNWMHLIAQTTAYDLFYKWFDVLQKKNHSVLGFVIMPNHVHLLLYYSGIGSSLNTLVGNCKRFMAYEIVWRLQQQNNKESLTILSNAVSISDKKREQNHKVWKDSFDWKQCRTERFVIQKLNYIHNNPCTGKWKLAARTVDYIHSSAMQYLNGKVKGYKIKDYREVLAFETSQD